jgi:sodium/myo-inositol cotransporter 11
MSSKGTEAPPRKMESIIVSLEENAIVKTLLDVNCIVCISCAIFLWGYFA